MLLENSKLRIAWRSLKGYISKCGDYSINLLLRLIFWDQLAIWMNDKFSLKKYAIIEHYLVKNYPLSKNDAVMDTDKKVTETVIWVFWWQGENHMPELCRICYHSLLKHSNGIKVNLLSKFNLSDYLQVQKGIKEKLKSGSLSLTNFSDIIRCMLLAKYGGLWVDATLYFTRDIPLDWFDHPFFSIKNQQDGYKFVSLNRWSTFIMGTNEKNRYFDDLTKLMVAYTIKEKQYLEYMTIDYFMAILFKRPEYKKLLDALPVQNEGLHQLRGILNDPYNKNEFAQLSQKNVCFKLSYKLQLKENVDGRDTYYAHLRQLWEKD